MLCRNALHHYRPAVVLPPDSLSCYPSHERPSLSDICELAGRGRLHTTDDDIVLLVRNRTPPLTTSDEPSSVGQASRSLNDEHIRIYVPILMRAWILQACHSAASPQFGTTRTLRMLKRFYLCMGMNVCPRW